METSSAIYAEAVRAMDQRARMLDELRNRAAALLAAIAVTTAFLTSAVFAQAGADVDVLVIAAFVQFAIAAGAAMFVSTPRRGHWVLALDAEVLLEHYSDLGDGEVTAWVTRRLAQAWRDNGRKMLPLYDAFNVAMLAFGIETALWIAKILTM